MQIFFGPTLAILVVCCFLFGGFLPLGFFVGFGLLMLTAFFLEDSDCFCSENISRNEVDSSFYSGISRIPNKLNPHISDVPEQLGLEQARGPRQETSV